MVRQTLFPPTPQNSPLDADGPSYAADAALVLQAMRINLRQSPLLDAQIAPTVALVLQKLGQAPPTATLKRQMMLVILSCCLGNAPLTLQALLDVSEPTLLDFINHLIDHGAKGDSACSYKKLRSPYEFKLFCVGLTNLIFLGCPPDSVAARAIPLGPLFQTLVLALTKQQRVEQRKLARQNKGGKQRKQGEAAGRKNNAVTQMVDSILKDAEELGFDASDNEGDLSGDEEQTPIFVIK